MDIIDIKMANKFASSVAAGFSKVEVDGTTINFTLNDGTKTSLTVPTPTDGVSVTGLQINNNKELICTLSNNTTINAGALPMAIPERGVDYWTQEDQNAINEDINTSLAKTFVVEVDDEHDTLIFKKASLE